MITSSGNAALSACSFCHGVTREDAQAQQPEHAETLKKVDKLFRCGQCQIALYCSRDCQTKHWAEHKPICLSKKNEALREALYKRIEEEAKDWQGDKKINLTCPAPQLCGRQDRPVWWGKFANFMQSGGMNHLLDSVVTEGPGKAAVDLGCGNSQSTLFLLQKQWNVIAVDYSQGALDVVQASVHKINANWLKTQQLTLVCGKVEDFKMPSDLDLVLAASSLPYFNPHQIRDILSRINQALKPGGYFVGNVFASNYINPTSLAVEKQMGAWFVKDESEAGLLLTGHGFEVITCVYGERANPNSAVFIAKKP